MLNAFNYTKANYEPKILNKNLQKQIPYEGWITRCKHSENVGRDIKEKVTNKL
jgi:hypothetical protein